MKRIAASSVDARRVIDQLGGTTAVAKLCEIAAPSVSEWRKKGIPRAREQFLRVLRPDVFGDPPTQERAA
jgi:hypothetical protein